MIQKPYSLLVKQPGILTFQIHVFYLLFIFSLKQK